MIDTNLHILLAKYRMSQKDLSTATGINKNAINRYYNNTFEKIDKEHLNILCSYFNCNPNDIFPYVNDSDIHIHNLPSVKFKDED